MTAADTAERMARRGAASLWLALATGPIASGLHLGVGYALVKWSCASRATWALALIAALSFVIAAGGAALALVHVADDRASLAGGAWSLDSRRLLALVALGLNVLLAVFIVNTCIAIATLSPCE